MTRILALLAFASINAIGGVALASLIVAGDPTTELEGDLFIDQASTTGGDTNAATSLTFNRVFDLNGLAGAPLISGEVTLKGFGFATNSSATNNTVETVKLTFTYLGQDGVFGGGDDVLVGSTEGFVWSDGISGNGTGWEGANQYYVNFGTTPSAMIDGLGETFRIELVATGNSVRFKTTTGTSLTAAKFSFSGTFAAVPEPSAMTVFGALGTIASLARRR